MVAFHFSRGNEAGWRCDVCRENGLERARRCGWLPEHERGLEAVVWARRGVRVSECPRSLVTPASAAEVERFWIWQAGGGKLTLGMSAKRAEAMLVLRGELEREKHGDGSRSAS